MEWTNLDDTAVDELLQADTCLECHTDTEMAASEQLTVPGVGSTMDQVHDRVLFPCPKPVAMTLQRGVPGTMIFPVAHPRLLQLLLQLAV